MPVKTNERRSIGSGCGAQDGSTYTPSISVSDISDKYGSAVATVGATVESPGTTAAAAAGVPADIADALPELRSDAYAEVCAWHQQRLALADSYDATDGHYLKRIRDTLTSGDNLGSGLWTRYLAACDLPERTARERIQKAEGRSSKRLPADSAAMRLLEPAASETLAALAAAVERQPEELHAALRTRLATAAPALVKSLAADLRQEAQQIARQRQRDLLAAQWTDPDARIECADIHTAGLEPESVDLIVTDPPYGREALPLYDILGRRAAHWLKPGGSLLVMCGESYLPAIYAMLGDHLRYQWTVAYLTPGAGAPFNWDRRISAFWKPVLWFVRGQYAGKQIGSDVVVSDKPDKGFHLWGQSESGMHDLLRRFGMPGDLVCDPFLGGGTTAVAAYRCGRRFVGFDIDPQCVAITRARLAEMQGSSDGDAV